MKKIPTLFDRDWNGNHKVINQLDPRLVDKEIDWSQAICTEKFNGTNVAVQIYHNMFSYYKRKNPTKEEKKQGIEPSYTAVLKDNPNDKYINKAFENTNIGELQKKYHLSDGLYSAEAIGPKIQGNPYKLEKHQLIFFSIPEFIKPYNFLVVHPTFDWLKEHLPLLTSHLDETDTIPIEGLVWHFPDKSMIKIKTEDFDYKKETC